MKSLLYLCMHACAAKLFFRPLSLFLSLLRSPVYGVLWSDLVGSGRGKAGKAGKAKVV